MSNALKLTGETMNYFFVANRISVLALVTLMAAWIVACDSEATDNVQGVSDGVHLPVDAQAPIDSEQPSGAEASVELGAAAPVDSNDSWYKPAVGARWQWQLQGNLNTLYDVDIYDIDLFDTPAITFEQLHSRGKRVICYFSAGTFENWRIDAGAFVAESIGAMLSDFPAERWLDIRSPSVRQVLRSRMELASQKGCDAVEPDNVDAYTHNTGFPLTPADQLDFNRWLALTAHEFNLGVGLKNDTDQVLLLVDAFDFVISEQCFEYNECERYTPFIDAGKPVFNAEYPQPPFNDVQQFIGICEESARLGLATLVMPLALDDSFRIDCADFVEDG